MTDITYSIGVKKNMICDCGHRMTKVRTDGDIIYFVCSKCGNKIIDII